MRRFLVHSSAFASLLLFLATLTLWVRGHWARDGVWYSTDTARYSLHSYRGCIWFWRLSGGRSASDRVWASPAQLHPGFVWDSAPDSYYGRVGKAPRGQPAAVTAEQYTLAAPTNAFPRDPKGVDWQALGLRYARTSTWLPIAQLSGSYPTARSTVLFVPHWAPALFFGLLSVAGARPLLLRWHRRRHGLCTACGYDLRATPGRCPECGSDAARAATADVR